MNMQVMLLDNLSNKALQISKFPISKKLRIHVNVSLSCITRRPTCSSYSHCQYGIMGHLWITVVGELAEGVKDL